MHGTQRPESEQESDAMDEYILLSSSPREEGVYTPRLSLWDLRCMRDIQGVAKLPLNRLTVAGNHRITGDHNFDYGNYAVPSHETRDINDDGVVPILPISFFNAAADFKDTSRALWTSMTTDALQCSRASPMQTEWIPHLHEVQSLPKPSSKWQCSRETLPRHTRPSERAITKLTSL